MCKSFHRLPRFSFASSLLLFLTTAKRETTGNIATNKGVTLLANTITIEAGSKVFADGQGYGGDTGLGAGSSAGYYGGGAGYGGWGSDSRNGAVGGRPYGNVYEPTWLGSGGGNGSGHAGQGGGAIHLVVTSTLTLNGVISANGTAGYRDGMYQDPGGGSGGSIWIETGVLTGTGTIQSNGGDGYGPGGGGAGGRIAIYYTTSSFSESNVQAKGGEGDLNGEVDHYYGGPGTIYWNNDDNDQDHLTVDNGGHPCLAAGLLPDDYEFDEIELNGFGHLVISGTTSTITLTNDTLIGVDGNSRLTVEGMLIAPTAFTVTGTIIEVAGGLSDVTNWVIDEDGGVTLHAVTYWYAGTHVYDEINVIDGQLILVPYDDGDGDYYDEDIPLTLRVNNLTVGANGVVHSNGLGYRTELGPGAGESYGSAGSGAGYGGEGGICNGCPENGHPYGSIYPPSMLGSGGGKGYGQAGEGGGAIHLVVTDTLTLTTGTISANGNSGFRTALNQYPGGGSGGSIWIEAGVLTGTGTINANGGSGYGNGGGGGAGGRIAIDTQDNNFSGSINVLGGSGYAYGDRGTIYPYDVSSGLSSLTITQELVPTDGTSFATLTVTVVNSNNVPLSGIPVYVAVADGMVVVEKAYIDEQLVQNNYDYVNIGITDAGIVTATIEAEHPGTLTITARVSEIAISQTVSVTFIAGPVYVSTSTVSVYPHQALADGTSPVTATVTVRDRFGNLIAGAPVTLTASGSATVITPTGTTNEGGLFTSHLTDTHIETVVLTATVSRAEWKVLKIAGEMSTFYQMKSPVQSFKIFSAGPAW